MPWNNRSFTLLRLIYLSCLLTIGSSSASSAPPNSYLPGRILIKFKGSLDQPQLQEANAIAGTQLVGQAAELGWHVMQLPEGLGVEAALDYYRALPEVDYVEPDYLINPLATAPNDPKYSTLWALERIGATNAWQQTQGSTNVVVGILDSGLDFNHADLASNVWTNTKEIAKNGKDDDLNGFVDDVHGINAATKTGDIVDETGHGSHVAGIIGAMGNNGLGVVGVNWRVSLLPVKIFTINGGSGNSAVILGYNYLLQLKKRGVNIRVINNSWGSDFPSRAVYEAICAAQAAGILTVCAAGNSRHDADIIPGFPASYSCEGILSVAASDQDDEPASFSTYGRRTVHLSAPGDHILSTYRKGHYLFESGTSMASPYVAGAAALLFSKSNTLSAASVKRLLLETVDQLPGWQTKVVSGGRLNVGRAMAKLISGPATNALPMSPETYSVWPHWTPISWNSSQQPGSHSAGDPVLSADGRYVAYRSEATNLVLVGTNTFRKIYLLDRLTGSNTLVSRALGNAFVNTNCEPPAMSSDGRFIVFASRASNLLASDTNTKMDVFLYDVSTGKLELISKSTTGGFGNGDSQYPSVTADGRYVSFSSDASNLVASDKNARRDVFVRDRLSQSTARVTVDSLGNEANNTSDLSAISADGRFVVFISGANNLVSGPYVPKWQIYLRDRTLGTTRLVSRNLLGSPGNDHSTFFSLSADGKWLAFQSRAEDLVADDNNKVQDIFLWNAETSSIRRLSVGNRGEQIGADCWAPYLSGNLRHVVFHTDSSSWLGPTTEPARMILDYDLLTQTLSPLSFNSAGRPANDGSFGPSLSWDGRFVGVSSFAWDLTPRDGNAAMDAFLLDRGDSIPDVMIQQAGDSVWEGRGKMGVNIPQRRQLFVDGERRKQFAVRLQNAGPTNATFLIRVSTPIPSGWSASVRAVGTPGDLLPQMVDAGWSSPPLAPGNELLLDLTLELTNVLTSTRKAEVILTCAGETPHGASDAVHAIAERPSLSPDFNLISHAAVTGEPGSDDSVLGSLSDDGRILAFTSDATQLVEGDFNRAEDVFLYDRESGLVECASRATSPTTLAGRSLSPSLSGDGRWLAFQSSVTNLVAVDSNGRQDIFLFDRQNRVTTLISVSTNNSPSTGDSANPRFSQDGNYVAFEGASDQLCPSDTNQTWDIFLWDRAANKLQCISRTPAGRTGNDESHLGSISADGSAVAFVSLAKDLVAGDTNNAPDVFLWRKSTGKVELVSRGVNGAVGDDASLSCSISADGRWVCFNSSAKNLVPGPLSSLSSTYLWDTVSNIMVQVVPPAFDERQQGPYGVGRITKAGKHLLFSSKIIPFVGASNHVTTTVLYDRETGHVEELGKNRVGASASDSTPSAILSFDGRWLALETRASSLIEQFSGEQSQLLLFDRASMAVDLAIRRSTNSPYRGENLIASGDQTIEIAAPLFSKVSLHLKLRNRGNFPDRLTLRHETDLFITQGMRYFLVEDGTEITPALANGMWVSSVIQPGAALEIRLEISANHSAFFNRDILFHLGSGSDTFKADLARLRLLLDQDGDQLPDVWERTYFPSITTTDASSDPDGDGASNLSEYLAGTHPLNASDFLRLRQPELSADSRYWILRWSGVAGRYYRVLAQPTLNGTWLDTAGEQPGNAGENEAQVPVNPNLNLEIFRLQIELP